jgi:DNA-binding GntR family transcriptional regulator
MERADRRHPPTAALADEAYQRLSGMLIDHQIPPGARVVVADVSQRLAVSATPIREALARLESEGLVVRRAMAGWTSAPLLDFRRFGELFEMRQLLEPEAARRAAATATPRELDVLADVTTDMARHTGGEYYEHFQTLVSLDIQFHRAVAEASGNRLLVEAIARLHAHVHLYRLYRKSGIIANTANEHAQVFEAICGRDPDAAATAMRRHIERSHARLAPWLTTAQDAQPDSRGAKAKSASRRGS